MYIRGKVVKGVTYYQAVEGYRDEAGRVRHRTLASLGRHPTVADALAATERELRRVRRETERERDFWPETTPRPAGSKARLAALERRTTRLDAQRLRLSGLLNGRVVDTTPRGDPLPAVVGDRAELLEYAGRGGSARMAERASKGKPRAVSKRAPAKRRQPKLELVAHADDRVAREHNSLRIVDACQRIVNGPWTPEMAAERYIPEFTPQLDAVLFSALEWLRRFEELRRDRP